MKKCPFSDAKPGMTFYVYHKPSDHKMQILLVPGNLVMILWEDTVPSSKCVPWIPKDYRILPQRWDAEELSIKMQEWAARNTQLINVGVDAILAARRLVDELEDIDEDELEFEGNN